MRIAVLGLSLALMVSASACSKPSSLRHGESERAERVRLVIWNDFHASLFERVDSQNPERALGGLPIFMAAVEHAKGKGPSLLMDAGDMFQGSMIVNASKGQAQVEIFNALGLDVAVLGNHEFDYGATVAQPHDNRASMSEAIAASKFKWVSSNISPETEADRWPLPGLEDYVILERGGYRFAFVGLTTQETPVTTMAAHVAGLRFEPMGESLKRVLPKVIKEKPDFIVVLAHVTGVPVGKETVWNEVATDLTFSDEIGEILSIPEDLRQKIDLLVTGHTHVSFIGYAGETLVLQTSSNGRELTMIDVQPKEGKLAIDKSAIQRWRLEHERLDKGCEQQQYPMDEVDVGGVKLKPDARALAFIKKYESEMAEKRCDVVGCVSEPMFREYMGESGLGNLVAAAMMRRFPQADVAIHNSGGLRVDFAAGKLYRETLDNLMPFDNRLLLVEMTGAQLADALRVAVSGKHGVFQIGNGQYRYEKDCKRSPSDLNRDGKTEAWEQNCLCEGVQIAGEAIDMQRLYKVALTDFMYHGGDSLGKIFEGSRVLEEAPVLKAVIMDYVQGLKACFSNKDYVVQGAARIEQTRCTAYLD